VVKQTASKTAPKQTTAKSTMTQASAKVASMFTQQPNGTRLGSHHHHIIMLVLMLIAVIFGIALGTVISDASQGTQGLLILVFALTFVNVTVSLLLFTQLMNRNDA
jgi:heme/copper-type cytochrome/quinol oxidase subunit 4